MAQKWTNSFRESNKVRAARRERALINDGFKSAQKYNHLGGSKV